jgi:hypothetical protein
MKKIIILYFSRYESPACNLRRQNKSGTGNAYKILVGNPQGKSSPQDEDQSRASVNTVMNLLVSLTN